MKENTTLLCINSRDVAKSLLLSDFTNTINMKKTTLGLGTLTLLLGTTGVFAGSALAYQGDPTVLGPNCSSERHEAMEQALETNNYEAWKNLMDGRGRVTQVINKDNFAKFAQIHELMEQGKIAEAQKIRQELGLGLRDGTGRMMGGMGMGRNMNR